MATSHATLPYNQLSNVIVGVAATDIGVIIDYACSRGTLYEAGVIKVLNRSGSIEIYYKSFGDDVGMSDPSSPITGDVSGGNIRLNITVNNDMSYDVLFNYNIVPIKA